MTTLAWGKKMSPEFRRIVIDIAQEIGFDPSWLMAYMQFESTLDPYKVNAASGALGLIQFMPHTLEGMGTNQRVLLAMSAEAQLDQLVRQYFAKFKGKIKTFSDGYMAILWPNAVDEPDDTVIFASGKDAYLLNRGLDLNHDGEITKLEASSIPYKRLIEGLLPENAFIDDSNLNLPLPDAPEPDIPQSVVTTPKETDMGAVLPFLPMILQMIPTLLHIPGLAAVANAVPVTGAAGGSPHAADYMPLIQTIVDVFTKAVPGAQNTAMAVGMAQADPAVQAVAAQAVLTHPSVAEELDKLAPTLDKVHGYDRDLWAAQAARSVVVAADKYDVAPIMVQNIATLSWYVLGGLVVSFAVAIFCKAKWPDTPDFVTPLIALTGPLLGQYMAERKTILSYRFDGSPTSNANAIVNQQLAADAASKAKS